uniref:Myosin motor domain-containing protein n=1 Tax=Timema douglasi TaxID=61478 RepID=A0A7R8VT61_TIMDO|nr:unnamed protein product [Timema douglasi]
MSQTGPKKWDLNWTGYGSGCRYVANNNLDQRQKLANNTTSTHTGGQVDQVVRLVLSSFPVNIAGGQGAMERDLHARDVVGVQDFVLLENFQSEEAFVDNLKKRFKANLIYFAKCFSQRWTCVTTTAQLLCFSLCLAFYFANLKKPILILTGINVRLIRSTKIIPSQPQVGLHWVTASPDLQHQTYIGQVLVSVNPYRNLNIYTTETIKEYQKVLFYEAPPHV